MNSITSAGLQGAFNSQAAIQQHANQIVTSTGQPADQQVVQPLVDRPVEAISPATQSTNNDVAQELVGIRQQAQLFTASASVISVGDEVAGSLLDDYS